MNLNYSIEKIIKIQNESIRVFIISYSSKIFKDVNEGGLFDPIGQLGKFISDVIGGVVENFLKPIKEVLGKIGQIIMDSVGGILAGFFNMIAQGFAGLINLIAQGISNIVNALINVFKWILDKITEPFRKLFELVSSHSPMSLEEVPKKLMAIFTGVILIGGPAYLLLDLASSRLFSSGFNFSGLKKFFGDIWKAIIPISAIFGAFAVVGLVPWIHRYVKASFRPYLPNMQEITFMYYNGYLSSEEAKKLLAQHGVPDNLIPALIHYNTFKFSFHDIYVLKNLGLITEADAIKLVKMHNVPEALANAILNIQIAKLPFDVIYKLKNSYYIDEKDAISLLKVQGIPENVAKGILEIQQPILNWDLIYFMERNGYIDPHEADVLYKLSGVPSKYINAVRDYVDYTPQPHQLLRYSEFIDFDLDFIKSCLAQKNVSEKEIQYYIRAFINASLRRIHSEIYTELEKCIYSGIPSKDKFESFLRKVGVKDFLIPYYLILYDIVLLRVQVKAWVDVYRTQLYYDLIKPEEFVDKCIKLGVNKELAVAWATEIEARKKRLWVPSG